MKSEEAEKRIDFFQMTKINPDQIKDIHYAAVMALVSSLDTLKESDFPETLSMDFEKLSQLRNQFHFFVVSASMLDIVKCAIIKTQNPEDLRVCRLLQTRCGCELSPYAAAGPSAHSGALRSRGCPRVGRAKGVIKL